MAGLKIEEEENKPEENSESVKKVVAK